jgi:hypothetical protein
LQTIAAWIQYPFQTSFHGQTQAGAEHAGGQVAVSTTIRWLHLTDLHVGMNDQDWLWPKVGSKFRDDLQRIYDTAGPLGLGVVHWRSGAEGHRIR